MSILRANEMRRKAKKTDMVGEWLNGNTNFAILANETLREQ